MAELTMHRLPLTILSGLAALVTIPSLAAADVLVTIDKATQHMTVAVDGQDRYSWPVSTGVPGHDTPSGSYTPSRMDRDHFSREWDDAPMPNSIFFTDMGHAIHGTGHVAALGRAASHGCVRLSRANSATLFALVKSEGMANTRVVVEGDDLGGSDATMAAVDDAPYEGGHARRRVQRDDPSRRAGYAPDDAFAPADGYDAGPLY